MLNPNTEVGGTAFAASIGRTSRQEIWGSIDLHGCEQFDE